MPLPTSTFIDAIFTLIGENKLKEAIQKLQPVIQGSDLFYEVLHQSSRLSSLSQSIRQGTLDIESMNIESNKIRLALSEITQLLKEKTEQIPKIQSEVSPIVQNIMGNKIEQSHSGSGDNVGGNKTVIFGLGFREIMLSLLGVLGIAIALIMYNKKISLEVHKQNQKYEYLTNKIHELEEVFGILTTAEVDGIKFEEASEQYDKLRFTLRREIKDANFRDMLGQYYSLKGKVFDPLSEVRQSDLKELSDEIMLFLNQVDFQSLTSKEM